MVNYLLEFLNFYIDSVKIFSSLYHVVCNNIDVKVEKNINKRDNGFDLDINLLLGK